MRIECPTCSIGFNVDDSQIGTKGRCPKCETKFVIPADPDDEIEVLEKGELPGEKGRQKAGGKEREEDKPAPVDEAGEADGEEASRDKAEPGEPRAKKPEEPRAKKREEPREGGTAGETSEGNGEEADLIDAGGVGKALGLLAIGLVLGLVIGFALGRLTADGAGGEAGAPPNKKDAFGLTPAP